jgi:hypothetical protein
MVFCGLNPNVTQRVEWCSSCVGLPPGMGWSNNIDYAMTTNCALGARYSDCDLDNEEGIDIGSVAVSVENQSFTVSLNEGYEITGYDIQVGSGLNTVASANFAGYQTRGGSLADGASVNSAVSFQGSDWFVMHAMVSVCVLHIAVKCLLSSQSTNSLCLFLLSIYTGLPSRQSTIECRPARSRRYRWVDCCTYPCTHHCTNTGANI